MIFRRYPSIQQYYYEKEIAKRVLNHPDLKDCMYSIQEKLHGANIQLYFINGVMSVGKRTSLIVPGDNFFDIWNALAKIKDITDAIALLSKGATPIILYGELFGGSVAKGVDYGPEQQIRFFDLKRGDEMQSPAELVSFAMEALPNKLQVPLVPFLDVVAGIDAVLAYNENFPTTIKPIEGNWAEGFVAKPLKEVFTSHQGSVFMIKKKNKKFSERKKAKKVVSLPSNVAKLLAVMQSLVTENRMESVFSKIGMIESPDQIGKYIASFVADCKEEMLKEHEELFDSLDSNQQKNACRIGHLVVPILKGHL